VVVSFDLRERLPGLVRGPDESSFARKLVPRFFGEGSKKLLSGEDGPEGILISPFSSREAVVSERGKAV